MGKINAKIIMQAVQDLKNLLSLSFSHKFALPRFKLISHNDLSIFTSTLATVHFLFLHMQHLILFSETMLLADLTLFSSIFENFFPPGI